MAKKVKEKKNIKKTVKKSEAVKAPEKYFYAVGRRKTSVAQVRLYSEKKAGEDSLAVNKRKMKEYFPMLVLQNIFLSALKTTGMQNKLRISVLVKGGGLSGQAKAIRLGIARALVKLDENLRKPLKSAGFLTRDARIVERKKPGLKKARRAPQWQKR